MVVTAQWWTLSMEQHMEMQLRPPMWLGMFTSIAYWPLQLNLPIMADTLGSSHHYSIREETEKSTFVVATASKPPIEDTVRMKDKLGYPKLLPLSLPKY